MKGKLTYATSFTAVIGLALFSNQLNVNATDNAEETQRDALLQKSVEQQSSGVELQDENEDSAAKQILQVTNESVEVQSENAAVAGDKEAVEVTATNYKAATLIKGAYLYAPKKTDNPIGVLMASTTSYSVKKVKNNLFYEILIGQKIYWIKESNLKESKKLIQKQSKKIAQSIQTTATYKIYNKASLKATVLSKGNTTQKIQIIDAIKGFYVVDLGSRKGYIPFKYVKTSLKSNQKVQLVAASKVSELKNGKKQSLGQLKRDAVIRISSSNATTVTFKSGKRSFIVDRSVVIPTTKKESFEKIGIASYPVTLTSKTAATIYSIDKKAVGTMLKGKKVNLIALKGNYGVIEYVGKNVYVKLNQFKHNDMVNPNKNISPGRYSYYVRVINQLYPEFTELEKIGQSVEGRAIYALKVGNGKKEILMDAALHAREHMTANVLMEMIDQYTVSYRANTKFAGYNTKSVLNKTAIWFVPMMNPDGVTLVQNGLKSMQPKNQKIIKAYNKSSNYKRWKSNARGVDLNRNFDGVWSLLGNTPKSFMGYKGTAAFSEPESKALKGFVERHKFKTNYSYHSSGQILYWYNFQNKKNYARDLNLTKKVSKITGYGVIAPLNNRASGSSADWFILKQKQPGLTVEIAPYAGNGPVPHKYWSSIWAKNKSIGLFGANEAANR